MEFPPINIPDLSNIMVDPPPITLSYSDTQFEVIKRYVEDFQASLDNDVD